MFHKPMQVQLSFAYSNDPKQESARGIVKQSAHTQKWQLIEWCDDSSHEATHDYWNDEVIEQEKKEFWIEEHGRETLSAYIHHSGLLPDLERMLDFAERFRNRPIRGMATDIAAGVCWAASVLVARGAETVVCIDFSRHRLFRLGPQVLEAYGVPPEKCILALGSFYDVRLDPGSQDVVILIQALHHADDPAKLLSEARRILAEDGLIIITGEHYLTVPERAKHATRAIMSKLPGRIQMAVTGTHRSPMNLRWSDAATTAAADTVLGDRVYSMTQYERMFHEADLAIVPWDNIGLRTTKVGFVLRPLDRETR